MKKFLLYVADNYQDLELWYPKYRLEEAGYKVFLIGEKRGEVYKSKHGYPCTSDLSFEDVIGEKYSGVIVPGGFAPDKLRRIPKALQILQNFHEEGKMIAFICHGGWVPISAKVLKGVKVTGTVAIKDDLENAGAIWEDSPVVVDKHFISSRNPGDLPFRKSNGCI